MGCLERAEPTGCSGVKVGMTYNNIAERPQPFQYCKHCGEKLHYEEYRWLPSYNLFLGHTCRDPERRGAFCERVIKAQASTNCSIDDLALPDPMSDCLPEDSSS